MHSIEDKTFRRLRTKLKSSRILVMIALALGLLAILAENDFNIEFIIFVVVCFSIFLLFSYYRKSKVEQYWKQDDVTLQEAGLSASDIGHIGEAQVAHQKLFCNSKIVDNLGVSIVVLLLLGAYYTNTLNSAAFIDYGILLTLVLLALRYLFMKRLFRTSTYVLWLRRFNIQPKQLRLQRLLPLLTVGLCQLVTLRDKTYATSGLSALRFLPLYLVLFPVFFVISYIISYMIFSIVYSENRDDFFLFLGSIPGMLAVFGGAVALYLPLFKRLGFSRIRTAQQASAVADRICKGVNPGIVILECKDTNWQAVVGGLIGRASVIVMDVIDVSDNIVWEVRKAISVLTPERVIFVCSGSSDVLESLLDKFKGEELQSSVRCCPVVVFPDNADRESTLRQIRLLGAYVQRSLY